MIARLEKKFPTLASMLLGGSRLVARLYGNRSTPTHFLRPKSRLDAILKLAIFGIQWG